MQNYSYDRKMIEIILWSSCLLLFIILDETMIWIDISKVGIFLFSLSLVSLCIYDSKCYRYKDKSLFINKLRNSEKPKKFISILLVGFIFMSHLVPIIHTFTHSNDTKFTLSGTSEFEQNSDILEHCCICDTYLKLDYSQIKSLDYILIQPSSISVHILKANEDLISKVLGRKKSRAPPYIYMV